MSRSILFHRFVCACFRWCCILYCAIIGLVHLALYSIELSRDFVPLYKPDITATIYFVCGGIHFLFFMKDTCKNCCLFPSSTPITQSSSSKSRLTPDHLFLLTLIFELMDFPCHSFQGYMFSYTVNNEVVALFSAMLAAIDCFGASVFVFYGRYNPGIQTSVFVGDVVVDMLLGIVIPSCLIIFPMMQFYNDPDIAYDLTWTARSLSYAKHVLITSSFDLLASIIPVISIHLWIDTIQSNCRVNDRRIRIAVIPAKIPDDFPLIESKRKFKLLQYVVSIFCLLWAIADVTIVLQSSPSLSICNEPLLKQACDFYVSPWFANKDECYCVVIHINGNKAEQNSTETLNFINEAMMKCNPDYVMSIWIDQSPITTLPKAMAKFQHALFVVIWRTRLQDIPFPIKEFKNARMFRVTTSHLTHIPITAKEIPSELLQLYFSESKIQKIPEWCGQAWENISLIDLAFNEIQELPVSLFKLRNLREMVLTRNQIRHIPREISNLKGLDILQCSGNRLTSIPSEILSLSNLSIILFMGNNIAFFEDTPWKNVSSLNEWAKSRTLMLSSNPICSNTNQSALIQSPICDEQCSDICDPWHYYWNTCDTACNTRECNYDNGACLVL